MSKNPRVSNSARHGMLQLQFFWEKGEKKYSLVRFQTFIIENQCCIMNLPIANSIKEIIQTENDMRALINPNRTEMRLNTATSTQIHIKGKRKTI